MKRNRGALYFADRPPRANAVHLTGLLAYRQRPRGILAGRGERGANERRATSVSYRANADAHRG